MSCGSRRRLSVAEEAGATPTSVSTQSASTLLPLARSQHANPTALLEDRAVFGDLIDQARFVEAYLWALESPYQYGAHAALQALVKHEC